MHSKASIFVRSLTALCFALAAALGAHAAEVRIVHLDCEQWHARQALLAYRAAHPIPHVRHRFGPRRGPRIHYVCDCVDGSDESGDASIGDAGMASLDSAHYGWGASVPFDGAAGSSGAGASSAAGAYWAGGSFGSHGGAGGGTSGAPAYFLGPLNALIPINADGPLNPGPGDPGVRATLGIRPGPCRPLRIR